MKIKTTRKAVVSSSENLVSAGYCDLQTLLRRHDPIAYTSGVYGWNFDVYQVYGLTICTGYRGMPGRTANNIREYESRARSIMDAPGGTWEEKAARVEGLLREFCAQADGKGGLTMNRYTVNGFTRISKAQARKLWANDTAPVYACPCNLRPGGPWSPEMQLPTDSGTTWEHLTSAAAYYVCGPGAGRYLAYYVAEGVLPQ